MHGAHDALHARARAKGVNPLVYWLARAVLQPFFHLYFRLSRIGREHVPDRAASSTAPTTARSSTRS